MKQRLQTFALFAVLVAVAVLVGSLVAGLGGGGDFPTEAEPRAARQGERVRVEVLNATGTPGLARAATQRLREAGFDVVYFGNAPGERRDTSEVLDRSGRLDEAREVADVLGIRKVAAEPDANLYLDASVLLGRDWLRAAEEERGGS